MENENNIKRYFDSLEDKKISISDENIKLFHQLCEKEYGHIDHNRYFVAENSDVNAVRKHILDNLSVEEKKKSIYLDMTVYILQAGKDVFISLS